MDMPIKESHSSSDEEEEEDDLCKEVGDEFWSDEASSAEEEFENNFSKLETITFVNPDGTKNESDWESVAPIPEFIFDENSLKVNVDPISSPLEIFELFFTPDILNYVIECTNNYGISLANNSERKKVKRARYGVFRPVTTDEMRQFLGLCLLQGQISTFNMHRYFSQKDILYFHPIFSYVMSGRRFTQLLRVISCAPLEAKGKDKVKHLIDMIIYQCQTVYGPNKQLSTDESLLHFRGKFAFKVYIKSKKSRYSIKFFELTTSDGYLLNMEMYNGAAANDDTDNSKVLQLMKPYLLKEHEIIEKKFCLEKIKPEEMNTYKQHMSVINQTKPLDQIPSTYTSPRKTVRWYKKVFFYLLDICVRNAFYIYHKYCKGNSKNYKFLQFRDELIKILLKIPNNIEAKDLMIRHKNNSRRTDCNVVAEPTPDVSTKNLDHWPEVIPGTPGSKSNKKSVFLKCKMCSKRGIRRESRFRCKGCAQKPALCPDCFEEWHVRYEDIGHCKIINIKQLVDMATQRLR